LAIHAAFAHVFFATGAADVIDSIIEDFEDVPVLAHDGSTDIAAALAGRLGLLITAH